MCVLYMYVYYSLNDYKMHDRKGRGGGGGIVVEAIKFTKVLSSNRNVYVYMHIYLGPHLTLGSLQCSYYFFVTVLHSYVQSCFSILMVNYMNVVKWEWYNS